MAKVTLIVTVNQSTSFPVTWLLLHDFDNDLYGTPPVLNILFLLYDGVIALIGW